ncbi:sensor histidine kinase [Aeromicrobium fastidiosum]|uniref:histidine kinase n=2 Tax=Aeromicrobium fastidiosum TaxID=52699 RepID=A0A641AP44_9ACTN|nr:HAMP domain-containing sensor histidine kinase [Aeromicrobium fastidiosum]KAA1379864.1 HAMP domain-containing histidine kinase [Aeromicrobium fastidiosum]MBP2389365.1 signal transduction histidine kinase [Aeromicrobium fastidiosum]
MRERLVVTLVSMTVGILAVFGVVRAYSTADLVRDQERVSVQQTADLAAVAIAARLQSGAPVTPTFLASMAGEDRRITFVDGQDARTSGGSAGSDGVDARRAVEGGGRVTVSESGSVQSERVSDALLPLVLLGLALAAAAAVIGWLLARLFARPFRLLADDATRIGDGHFDVKVHHSSISEAEDLGNALRRAASQLDTLVRRERELATVASHELRTPITALRLSLEDLSLWPQTPADVAEELQRGLTEVDRLSDVVSTLLESGDRSQLGAVSEVELRELAGDAVDRWADRARHLRRPLLLGSAAPLRATVVRASVDRILDELVENALLHGTGTVTVDAVVGHTYAGIGVSDEGAKAFQTGVLHASPAGGSHGLTEAAVQAESLGGFISVIDVPETRVVLALPLPGRATDHHPV